MAKNTGKCVYNVCTPLFNLVDNASSSIGTCEVLHSRQGKGKAKLSLCLTKHDAVKSYGEVEVYLHVFLTSALVGAKWSASRPGHFTPRKEPPVPTG
jgi:hypothetical protein